MSETQKIAELLKPCPFCATNDLTLISQDLCEDYYVYCNTCFAQGSLKDSSMEAFISWNSRQEAGAIDPPPSQQVAAISTSDTTAVCVEDLLMKLSLSESVIIQLTDFIEAILVNPDANIIPPDQWAVAGMFQSINDVRHALKCLCWGHAEAHQH